MKTKNMILEVNMSVFRSCFHAFVYFFSPVSSFSFNSILFFLILTTSLLQMQAPPYFKDDITDDLYSYKRDGILQWKNQNFFSLHIGYHSYVLVILVDAYKFNTAVKLPAYNFTVRTYVSISYLSYATKKKKKKHNIILTSRTADPTTQAIGFPPKVLK